MGVLQTHMAKMYYAQRLPQESIDRLKDYAEMLGIKPAEAMEKLINAAVIPDGAAAKRAKQYKDSPNFSQQFNEAKKPKPSGKPLPQFKVTVKAPITKPRGKIL